MAGDPHAGALHTPRALHPLPAHPTAPCHGGDVSGVTRTTSRECYRGKAGGKPVPRVAGRADEMGCDRSTLSAFLTASSRVSLLLFLSCHVNTQQALLQGTAAQRRFGEVPLIGTE